MSVMYRVLALGTAAAHLGFIVFVPAGGFLAWRHRRVLIAHVPAAAWALGIVTVGWTCPLTDIENALRVRAGAPPYEGGFVGRYLRDVVYPGQYERMVQGLVAVAVLASYAGLVRRLLSTRRSGDIADVAIKQAV
jgi:Protein of Unknown function (DUF2784)